MNLEELKSTNNEHNTKDKENKNSSKITKVLAVLATLIILILLALHSCGKQEQSKYGITLGTIEKSPRSQEELDELAEQGMFTTFLNKNLLIEKDGTANVMVQNAESNKYSAYVEYYLNDELIFKTDTIEPKYKQDLAKIDYKLEPGTYEAKAVFCIVDDLGNKLNTVTTPIKITKQ